MPDEFEGLVDELEDVDLDAVRLQPTRMRWLSVVGKGANRRSWRILKADDGSPVVAGGDADAKQTVIKTIAKNALRLMRAVGGRTEDEITVKIASATGGVGTREHVIALAFDAEAFTPETAGQWAAERGFKAEAKDVEQEDGGFLVHLQKVPDGTDCATVLLAEGVAAVVRKSDPPAFTSKLHVAETGTLRRRTPPMPTRSLGTNTGANAGSAAKDDESRVVALILDRKAFVDAAAVRKWIAEDGPAHALVLTQKEASGLAAKYKDAEHPFTACMADMMEQGYDEAKAQSICGKMKSLMNGSAEKSDVTFDASVVEDHGDYFRVPQLAESVERVHPVTITKGIIAVVEGGVTTTKENETMTEKALEAILDKAVTRIKGEIMPRIEGLEARAGGDSPGDKGDKVVKTEDASAGTGADDDKPITEERVGELIVKALDRLDLPGLVGRVTKAEQRLSARVPLRRGDDIAGNGNGRAHKGDDDEVSFGGVMDFGGRRAR